jgi:hypothetical protein
MYFLFEFKDCLFLNFFGLEKYIVRCVMLNSMNVLKITQNQSYVNMNFSYILIMRTRYSCKYIF